MSIQRRNKIWYYTIVLNGKTYRGSCKTQIQSEAQEYHDHLRSQIWRGQYLREVKKHTVDEAIDKFLYDRRHKRSWRDDDRYGQWWKAQFKSAQVKWLEDVTPDVVADIRDEEVNRVSVASVNRKLAFLRSVIRSAAMEWLWIDKAPKFRLLPGEMERRRFLEPHEVVRLVEALPRPFSDMALLAVSTGLRQGNILNLKWSEVDLSRRMLVFSEKVMKNGQPFSIPINETATSVIRKWVGQDDTYVFVKKGQRVREVPSKMWADTLKKAGLVDLRWHDLRHTWASLMRQSGIGLDDLQELGGWESPIMVQRYAHLNVEHLAPKAAVLDGLLSRKPLHEIRTAVL